MIITGMQGITIKRKHFLSVATPFFDEDIHSSGTVKENKTSNQYFIEVFRAQNAHWQNVTTVPDFRETGMQQGAPFPLKLLKPIPEKAVHLLMECR